MALPELFCQAMNATHIRDRIAVVEGDIDAFLEALMKDEQQRKLAELAPV